MARWRKSTYSGLESDCIELASTLDAIRDSKNPKNWLQVRHLDSFLRAVKEGTVRHS